MPQHLSGKDDDHTDLAALDFSTPDGADEVGAYDAGGEVSALDELHTHEPEEPEDAGTDLAAIDPLATDEDEEDVGPVSTVTNPPGTVSVSAFIDGRIQEVELTSGVTSMTEAALAEEILVISELARQKARGSQQTFLLDTMGEAGTGGETGEMLQTLQQSLHLPSPEEAAAVEAEVFATRYKTDDDD